MHRKLLQALFVGVLGFGSVAAAHGTPITAGTYTLTNTSVSAGSTSYMLTGTVMLGSDGLITGANITLNDAAIGSPVFNTVGSKGGPAGYNPVADFAYITSASGGQLYLSYLTTFDTSGNIDLCILSANDCNSYQASYSQLYFSSAFGYNPVDLNGGTLDPGSSGGSSVTPEPSSLWLMATGLVGAAGAVRRRSVKA